MSPYIRLLQIADLESVVKIHCQVFPISRSTSLGKAYVRQMFRWYLTRQSDLCLAAEENGQVIGYVVGSIGGYGRKIFRYAFPQIAFGLLTHPNLWLKRETFLLWHSYLLAFSPAAMLKDRRLPTSKEAIHMPIRGALAGIGVLPSARGKGVGKMLVEGFEKSACTRHAELLGLSVAIDNLSARRLYEICGWHVDTTDFETNSVHYSKVLTTR